MEEVVSRGIEVGEEVHGEFGVKMWWELKDG